MQTLRMRQRVAGSPLHDVRRWGLNRGWIVLGHSDAADTRTDGAWMHASGIA